MSDSLEEMSKKLAERLKEADKEFAETFKSVVQPPEGPQGVRFNLVADETGKYLQNNYNSSSDRALISEEMYDIIKSTGATGPPGPFFDSPKRQNTNVTKPRKFK